MIERKAVNAVQGWESGEVLEGISFNRSDSIVVQRSAENEKIEGLSENEKISYLQMSSRITDIRYEVMLSE